MMAKTRDQISAFLSPWSLPSRGIGLTSTRVCSTRINVNRTERTVRTCVTPRMQQTKSAKKEKGKKRATPSFATDIKGNIVWTLRSATNDDIDDIFNLVEHLLPRDLVKHMISNSPCCTVCEASVKGTKEGEGYSPAIMGVVLVQISLHAKNLDNIDDDAMTKHGEIITIVVDEDFTESEAAKKMLLGSLKKMKNYGVIEVTHNTNQPDRTDLVKQCLFKEHGTNEFDTPTFLCNLAFENPEPMKKMI